jgi:hypothetical protein
VRGLSLQRPNRQSWCQAYDTGKSQGLSKSLNHMIRGGMNPSPISDHSPERTPRTTAGEFVKSSS